MELLIKKQKTIIFSGILLTIIILIGLAFSYFRQTNDIDIRIVGCFSTSFKESDRVTFENLFPMSDEEGKKTESFNFTIRNICDYNAIFQLNMEILNISTVNPDYIKIYLDNNLKMLNEYEVGRKTLAQVTTAFELITHELSRGEEITYSLNVWIDENAIFESGNLVSKLTINRN